MDRHPTDPRWRYAAVLVLGAFYLVAHLTGSRLNGVWLALVTAL